jgi:hypothetical protein
MPKKMERPESNVNCLNVLLDTLQSLFLDAIADLFAVVKRNFFRF